MPISGPNDASLISQVKAIQKEMRQEYLQPHSMPWVVGFSGGKDSTLLVQLVVETILSIAPDQRTRQVYIIYNDTLVESPVFQAFVERTLSRIAEGIDAHKIPLAIVKTEPDYSETFWVNLLGRGYPAPNHFFRWCMDRLKIHPTASFIKSKVAEFGGAILLLGVRKAESLARANRLNKHSVLEQNVRLSPNKDIPGCLIFRPIMDLSTQDVWTTLENNPPPWDSDNNQALFDLYKDAGLCNATSGCALADELEPPNSQTILARFGCWTCTVVEKDKSLAALIDAGYENLKPLALFRDRIKEVSANPIYRSKTRRNGQQGLGPLILEARRFLLDELLQIQAETGLHLISDQEVRLIREWWNRDECDAVVKAVAPRITRREKKGGL